MSGYNVSLSKMADAQSVYATAAEHFSSLAAVFEQQVAALREQRAFDGGYGLTGAYQAQLSNFGSAWLGMIGKFVADERSFALFLEGFAARLLDTHDLYQELETRNGAVFDNILKSLDKGD